MRPLLLVVALAGCAGPSEPSPTEWDCEAQRPAYYVPNVAGSYTLMWHCDDPDAAGTDREWWVGEDYPSPPADSVTR